MPRFVIEVERDYIARERLSVTLEANTAEEALAAIRSQERDGEIEAEWHEHDGGAEPSSYRFTAYDRSDRERQHVLAEVRGSLDEDDQEIAA